MSELRRYPDYKDSGVPWLGEIPSHWEAKRIKFVVNNINKKVEASETELRYFGLENIESFTGKLKNHIELISEGVGNEFGSGDVLFGKLRPYLSKVYLTNQAGLASTEALILRSTESIEPKFLKYYCLSPDFIDQVNGTTFGSKMPRASWDGISSFKISYPNVDEQQSIVNFLDIELEHIDKLISKQQQLIEKLAEQRSAVITNAVTKGLDTNVAMKDSGVEWLGQVPEHWIVKSIKHISRVHRGASPRPIADSKYFDDEGEYAWVRISDVTASDDYLLETTQKLSELGASLSVKMQPDQIFLSIAGSVGKPIITKIKACIHDGFVYFPDWNQSIRFLYYIFVSGQPYLGLGKMGTQLNLNTDTVGSIKIGVPSIEEQEKIVSYIDLETKKIDQMSKATKDIIAKLQEYRSALITQAVTGKIDVSHLNKKAS